MSGITLTNVTEASISTPASGKVTIFNDSDASDTPAFKDDTGTVTSLVGPTGATGPGYGGTSTTSLAISVASKSFTTQAGLAYLAGSRVRAASAAAPDTDWMEGDCTSYSGTTLVVNVDTIGGSGTHADWNLSIAGEVGQDGAAGAGVPPTVVSHGSMGAAETFDYGDGPAHEGTYDAALTVTLTGWVAGECIETLDFTTDATGGYGAPTFGAEVLNAADLAAVWIDTAGARNVIVLRTIDSGTEVYIMGIGTTPTLDAVITVSSGQDIADALSGAASPSAANVLATMADLVAGVGSVSGISYAKESGAVALTTGLTDVTGATLTITPSVAETWLVVAMFDLGWSTTNAGNVAVGRPVYSGTGTLVEADATLQGNSIGRCTCISLGLVTGVTAEAHTIKLQVLKTGAGGVGGTNGNSALIVLRVI